MTILCEAHREGLNSDCSASASLDFAGSVYVFARTGSLWTEELKLAAFDGAPLDKFGFSLGYDGSSFVSGAPQNDQTASNGGAAYVYELLRSSEFFCTGKINSLGCVPFLSTSGVASTTSSDPFARGNLNLHGGKLCVKAPFTRLVPKTASRRLRRQLDQRRGVFDLPVT